MSTRSRPPGSTVAQLTYTSFEGGWQIKQVDGLLPAEQAELVRQVPTRLSLLEPLPRFPSADELDALPRRLVYARRDGRLELLHASQAGDDGAGRPGNVFTHVLVLDARAERHLRPVELWRSPRWLAPFGQAAVRAAEYDPAAPPGPHPGTSREAAVDFVLDPSSYRFSGMSLLLDAVAQALAGGRSIVLLASDVDEGARWLSLVSWLGAAASLQRLSFSTYERGADLAVGAEHLLSVVVRGHLAVEAAVAQGLLVVDPTWDCEFVDDGGRERLRTPYEQEVEVTAWSGLALDILGQGREAALRTLELADEVAWAAPAQAAASAWWPLAVAVARTEGLSLAWPLAARVVVSRTLDRELPDELRVVCTDLVRRSSGETADEAWALLQHCADNEALLAIVYPAYVARVLADRQLLLGEHQRPLPTSLPAEHVLDEVGRDTLPVMQAEADRMRMDDDPDEKPETQLYHLRLLDFVSRAGVARAAPGPAAALAGSVARAVVSDAGEALLQRAGIVHAHAWQLVQEPLGHQVRQVPQPPGRRLPTSAVRQLEAVLHPLTSIASIPLSDARNLPLVQEISVAACLRSRWPEALPRSVPLAALLESPYFAADHARPELRLEAALVELRSEYHLSLGELSTLCVFFADHPRVDLTHGAANALLALDFPAEGAALAAELLKSDRVRALPYGTSPRRELELVSRLSNRVRRAPRQLWDEVGFLLLCGLDLWPDLHDKPGVRKAIAPHLLVAAIRIAAWPTPSRQGYLGQGVDTQDLARQLAQRRPEVLDLLPDGLGGAVLLVLDALSYDEPLLDSILKTCVDGVAGRGEPGVRRAKAELLLGDLPAGLVRRHEGMPSVAAALLRPYWLKQGPKAAQGQLERVLKEVPEFKHKLVKSWWGVFAPQTSRLQIPRRKD